jgi:hypothetical protein
MFLLFTVYALIAVEVFGLTRLGRVTSEYANFRTFGTALLTFFRMMTGEAWNKILRDMMVEAPECVENEYTYLLSDCGSTSWALLLFLSYEVLVTLALLALFVVTIIDNFDSATQNDSLFTLLTHKDMSNFKQAWAEFDPDATGYIPSTKLVKFLRVILI